MSSNNIKTGIALLAVACAGGLYAGYKKFGGSRRLTPELLLQILNEVKFQVFNGCILFAETIKKNVLSRMPNDEAKREQIKSKVKDEVLEMYEEKERLILLKYAISKEDFEVAVGKHEQDLKKIEEEIENLMLDAIAGKLPDFTVPEQIRKAFPMERVFALYREMLLIMIDTMIKAFKKELENPEFNLADEQEYLRVIRSIHVFQLKEKFFTSKEFVCPEQNLTFTKLMEQYKRRDREFAEKAKLLEKAYESFVQTLTLKVEQIDFEEVKVHFLQYRLSREDAVEGFEMPEPPEMSWQASSTTQGLANWVHADKGLMTSISAAIKGGKESGPAAVLTASQAGEMLGADNIRHDFSKKHVVEAPKEAEPIVEREVAPVAAEPSVEIPVEAKEEPPLNLEPEHKAADAEVPAPENPIVEPAETGAADPAADP